MAFAGCGGDDDSNGSTSTSGGGSGGSSATGGSGGTTGTGGATGGSGGDSSTGGSGGTTSTGGSGGTSSGGSAGSAGSAGAGGAGNEMTMFTVKLENLEPTLPIRQSGAVAIPEGADEAGPIGPGGSFEIRFAAAPGDKLSFATMFGQSNDLFLAPEGAGIELFDSSNDPISGDVTDQVMVWDAGTEANQPLGEGTDQAPRQSAPNTGPADSDDQVRAVASNEYDNLPAVVDMFSATLTPDADGIHFTLTIENTSAAGDLMTSGDPTDIAFSPVAFAVHTNDDVLFSEGGTASTGLERLAEDGNPSVLVTELAPHTGILSPISPGVWAVHSSSGSLFTEGEPDSGMGLEAQAEDGSPAMLADSLTDADFVHSSGIFNTPDGASDPGPATPGNSFTFEIEAMPGDMLSFTTMFGQSNDLFFAPSPDGIALFDNDDEPVNGDVTDMIMLWDAGTEVNEPPGLGPNQAPRQSDPNTGDDENGNVMLVDDGYSYASPTTLLKVTITPE